MEFSYQFVKEIDSQKLHLQISGAQLPVPKRIDTVNESVIVVFNQQLTENQQSSLESIVDNHVRLTTVESLSIYLDNSVFPFVKSLINSFAAENISMGITQAQKTGHVLSLFTKRFPVPSSDFQNSLKDSFDTGSLYMSIAIIDYIRNNSSEFSGLSPFITDERLLNMKNKIEIFLGINQTS